MEELCAQHTPGRDGGFGKTFGPSRCDLWTASAEVRPLGAVETCTPSEPAHGRARGASGNVPVLGITTPRLTAAGQLRLVPLDTRLFLVVGFMLRT